MLNCLHILGLKRCMLFLLNVSGGHRCVKLVSVYVGHVRCARGLKIALRLLQVCWNHCLCLHVGLARGLWISSLDCHCVGASLMPFLLVWTA